MSISQLCDQRLSPSHFFPGVQKSQGTGPVWQRYVCCVPGLHTLSPCPPNLPWPPSSSHGVGVLGLHSGPVHLSPSPFIQTLRLGISTAHSITPPLEVLGRGGVSAGLACGQALELGSGPRTRWLCVHTQTHTQTHTTGSCPRIEAAQKLLPGFFFFFLFPSLSYLRPYQSRN